MGTRTRSILVALVMLVSLFPATAFAATADVPSPPASILADTGAGFVKVTWSAPLNNGGSAVTGYRVYRSDTSGGATTQLASLGTVLTWNDTTGTPRQHYWYTVTAVNAIGESASSAEAEGYSSSSPSVPTNVAATAGNTTVTLTWGAPSNNGGYAVTGFAVYRSTSSGAETLLTTLGYTFTWTNTSLTNGTTYYYKVAAMNAIGTGTKSAEVSAKPSPTPPGAPASLTAATGNGLVKLTWTAPSNTGGSAVTGYRVYRSETPGGEKRLLASLGTVLTWSDTSGVLRKTYSYSVTAVNAMGEGASTVEVTSASSVPPSAPTNVAATAGNITVTLTWGAPSDNGGSAVTGYAVYRATTSGAEVLLATLGNVLTYTNASLTNGTTYYYKVASITAIGTGSQSVEVSAKPAPQPPSAPKTLTTTAGNGLVKLTWTAPATTGGSSITGYRVYRSDTSGGATTLLASLGTVLTWSDTTGVARQTYFYTVKAVNLIGEGASSVAAAGASAVPPSAPANVVATAGYLSAKLTWAAPADNGGSVVTGYVIYRSTVSGAEVKLATLGNVLTYTNSSLTNGTTYFYRVAATTAIGTGIQSDEASAKPAPQAPSAITALTAATSSTAGVKLSWKAPSSNGSAITGYRIYRGTSAGTETFLVQIAATTSWTDTGTTPGIQHYYRIAAVNAIGEAPLSNEASATAK